MTYRDMVIADVMERNSRHKHQKPIPIFAKDARVIMAELTSDAVAAADERRKRQKKLDRRSLNRQRGLETQRLLRKAKKVAW